MPKIVASTTLKEVSWGNSNSVSLMEGTIEETITKLKQQPGKNIGVSGSIGLVQSLLRNNLLDQLSLQIHPAIAGKGKRLFEDYDDVKRLKVIKNKTSASGVLMITYEVMK